MAEYRQSLEPFTLEFASKTCNLPVETLKRVAHMIAEEKGVCVLWAMGVTQHSNGSDTSTAISNLLLVTGNYMRPGTGAYPLRGHNNVQGASDHGAMPNMVSGYQPVNDPEVRVLVQDIFFRGTCQYADVVLPASPSLEKDGTFTSTERRFQRLYQVFEPLPGSRPDFDRLGMARTSLVWREGFAGNLANGWNDQGQPQEHDQRSKVRVAGSMDTTISDLTKFVAALVRGDGLSADSRAEMTKPRLHIATAHQFPLFLPDLPMSEQRKDLSAGLGVVVFDGPQGRGFFKGGHDGATANTIVCIEAGQRCAVILSNAVRSEAGFADLVRFILGDTAVPYNWEYGDHAGKS